MAGRFNVGDRVCRKEDVKLKRFPLRVGVITKCYAYTSVDLGGRHFGELYEIEWADGTVADGYLPKGLTEAFEEVPETHGASIEA